MPERFVNDDYYVRKYDAPRRSSASWLVPLLMLPIAFLGGWVANGYVNEGQIEGVPQIEVGVGGGPEDREIISPLPTTDEEMDRATATPTIDISPTEQITPTKDVTPTPSED